MVALGAVIGGFIAANWLSTDSAVAISSQTIEKLQQLGIQSAGTAYLPSEIFALEQLRDPKTLALLVVGGFFVGFGTRYAGGCTSGHAITGLSNLQLASFIAVIGFFIGGLFINHLILPYLL